MGCATATGDVLIYERVRRTLDVIHRHRSAIYLPHRRRRMICRIRRYPASPGNAASRVIFSGRTVKISIGVLIVDVLQTPPLCFRDRDPLRTFFIWPTNFLSSWPNSGNGTGPLDRYGSHKTIKRRREVLLRQVIPRRRAIPDPKTGCRRVATIPRHDSETLHQRAGCPQV